MASFFAEERDLYVDQMLAWFPWPSSSCPKSLKNPQLEKTERLKSISFHFWGIESQNSTGRRAVKFSTKTLEAENIEKEKQQKISETN